MMQGPWLFRNMAVLLCPYDDFSKAEEVEFSHNPIWLQIHKIPEGFCRKNIVENLLKNFGEILEMRLNGNTRGDYIRVRVEHDIKLPLTKFVSIVRSQAKQVFLVRYEKLARFCKFCGLIGHEHKECGSGVHDQQKLKFVTDYTPTALAVLVPNQTVAGQMPHSRRETLVVPKLRWTLGYMGLIRINWIRLPAHQSYLLNIWSWIEMQGRGSTWTYLGMRACTHPTRQKPYLPSRMVVGRMKGRLLRL